MPEYPTTYPAPGIFSAGANALGSTGVYAPPGALANWKVARAAAGARAVNVVLFGDSVSQGYWSSNWATKPYLAVLGAALRAAYGDGGSGFVSLAMTKPNGGVYPGAAGGTPGAAGPITYTGAGGVGANPVGGWNSIAFGINSYSLYPNVAGSGVTLTVPVAGRFIDIYWEGVAAVADFTYQIDGGGVITVHTQSSAGLWVLPLKTTIDTGVAGAHTVVLAATAGSPILWGVTGRNATGVQVHNMSLGGRLSAAVSLPAAGSLQASETVGKCSIQEFSPDLFIYCVGVNDAYGAAVTADAYLANVAVACDYAKAYSSAADIVILQQHRGSNIDTTGIWPAYSARSRALADAYDALMVNLWSVGKNTYGYWAGLGYWGDGTADGLAGGDGEHPSDVGHAYIGNFLAQVLTAA